MCLLYRTLNTYLINIKLVCLLFGVFRFVLLFHWKKKLFFFLFSFWVDLSSSLPRYYFIIVDYCCDRHKAPIYCGFVVKQPIGNCFLTDFFLSTKRKCKQINKRRQKKQKQWRGIRKQCCYYKVNINCTSIQPHNA